MKLSAFSESCFRLARIFFEMRVQLIVSLYQEVTNSSTSSSRSNAARALESLHTLMKHLHLYGKMFLRMQKLNVHRFVSLPHANELVLYYWAEVVKATNGPLEMISGEYALDRFRMTSVNALDLDSPDAVYPVRFLVQCMILFRESLNGWAGKMKSNNMAGRLVLLPITLYLTTCFFLYRSAI